MLTSTEALNQFDRYMRARNPIIAIRSHEESRILRELKPILKERRRACYTWTYTSGINHLKLDPADTAPRQIDPATTRDPQACIRKILEYPRDGSTPATVFILRDLHPFLKDAGVNRLLRDLVEAFETGNHTLVLISPAWNTPPDLEKAIVAIDWPLPDQAEIAAILKRVEGNLPRETLRTLNGNRDAVISALLGLTAFEVESTILNAVIQTKELGESMIPHIVREKKQIIQKSGALEFYEADVNMSAVGGLPRLKEYARRKMATFSPKAKERGVQPAKGVILTGIPGVGKSLAAKAFAGGRMPLLRLDMGAVFGSLVGQSEQQMRESLKLAETIAPCILWIDEIEKALGGGGGEQDGGTSKRVFGTLLTWMQEKKAPVFVIATANDISALKGELLRRFDDIIFVDLPCLEDRAEIASIHLAKRNCNPAGFDLTAIAKATHGYTGAEIEKVITSALEAAFVEDGRDISTDDLIYWASNIVPLSIAQRGQIDGLRAWAREAQVITAAMPLEDPTENSQGRQVEI